MEEAQQTVTETMEALRAGVAALQERAKADMDQSMQKIAEARAALKNAEASE